MKQSAVLIPLGQPLEHTHTNTLVDHNSLAVGRLPSGELWAASLFTEKSGRIVINVITAAVINISALRGGRHRERPAACANQPSGTASQPVGGLASGELAELAHVVAGWKKWSNFANQK